MSARDENAAREFLRWHRELEDWRDNIVYQALFSEWGAETVDWMYFLGADAVLDRAQQLDGPDSFGEATGKVVGRFKDLVIDHLIAARKREQSPDDPLAVLLEQWFWEDVDKARIDRAIHRLDEAAKLAVHDLLAEEPLRA